MYRDEIGAELERAGVVIKPQSKLREVKAWQLLLFFLLPLTALPFAVIEFIKMIGKQGVNVKFCLLLAVIYVLVRMFAMGCIYVYKAFAPMWVRERCRFNPSCSQYTLLSIGRYGLLIGILMGSLRIHYCTPPYGGDDPPRLCHILRLFNMHRPDAVLTEKK